MAFITVGIDTSRVYNRKQPPGGQSADLFGGHPGIGTGDTKNRKLNRMLSNVELGSDKDMVEQPIKTQKKSQPSVCPVTGETIGHNMPAIQPVSKTETKTEIVKKETIVEAVKTENKAESTSGSKPCILAEPKAESKPAPEVTAKESAKTAPVVQQSPAVSEVPKAIPASAEVKSAPQDPKATDTQPPPVIIPTPLPPASNPVLTAAPSSAADQNPVMTSSAPAPVKTRRVPPGGHTTALW